MNVAMALLWNTRSSYSETHQWRTKIVWHIFFFQRQSMTLPPLSKPLTVKTAQMYEFRLLLGLLGKGYLTRTNLYKNCLTMKQWAFSGCESCDQHCNMPQIQPQSHKKKSRSGRQEVITYNTTDSLGRKPVTLNSLISDTPAFKPWLSWQRSQTSWVQTRRI